MTDQPAAFRPLYVCGCMRTGTTILQKVICQSPDANAFAPAARYLMEQVRLYARFAGPDAIYVEDHFGGVGRFRTFTHDLITRVLDQAWDVANQPAALVLKSPELSPFVPDVAELLGKDARFIFAMREPKDTIASMIRVGDRQREEGMTTMLSQLGRDIDGLCRVYLGAYVPVLRALQDKASPLRDHVMFSKYEDLAADPQAAQSRIAAFCGIAPGGLPADDAWPTSASSAQLAEHPRWRTYITDLSNKPVSTASIDAYKAFLSGTEAAKVDELCAGIRRAMGYL